MSKGPGGAQVNRRTAPVFAVYLVVIVAGIAAAVAIGLARGSDDAAAGETVERFARAIESRDGAAACRELAEGVRQALERQERRPCEEAVVELELSGGEVTHVDVAETSAAVDLSEGDRSFLDETPRGWRISAAGCKPRPERPYECELES